MNSFREMGRWSTEGLLKTQVFTWVVAKEMGTQAPEGMARMRVSVGSREQKNQMPRGPGGGEGGGGNWEDVNGKSQLRM